MMNRGSDKGCFNIDDKTLINIGKVIPVITCVIMEYMQ